VPAKIGDIFSNKLELQNAKINLEGKERVDIFAVPKNGVGKAGKEKVH
jgi:hypothetical protein